MPEVSEFFNNFKKPLFVFFTVTFYKLGLGVESRVEKMAKILLLFGCDGEGVLGDHRKLHPACPVPKSTRALRAMPGYLYGQCRSGISEIFEVHEARRRKRIS